MKVPNSTIDAILDGGMKSIDGPAAVALISALAADLKEARQVRRQVVRAPAPVIAAAVSHPLRVETPSQLRMSVPEPFASMVEYRAKSAAKLVDCPPYPIILVPRTGLWILQLQDVRNGPSAVPTAVCRGASMEELADLLARERAQNGAESETPYKVGGPLQYFKAPQSTDCFVNALESMDNYLAHAIASLNDASKL